MESIKTNLLTFAFSVIAIAAIECAAFLLKLQAQSPALLYIALVRLIEIGVLLVILRKGSGSLGLVSLSETGIKRILWRSLGWSAVCCFAIIALYWLMKALDPVIWQQLSPKQRSRVSPGLLFITGGLLSPIAEELFFRRIIFGFFRRWGFYLSTLISTSLFILPHLSSATLPLLPLMGGIILALVYEKEKYLLAPILVHITANTLWLIFL
jgi:uncharacterized protein